MSVTTRYSYDLLSSPAEHARLVRRLTGKSWAGPSKAADLAQDAQLALLELAAAGKKLKNLYYLALESARTQHCLPVRNKKTGQWTLTRDQVEQLTNPGELSATDRRNPESVMIAAEDEQANTARWEQVVAMIRLLRPDLLAAVSDSMTDGMAHACRMAAVSQTELSRTLKLFGKKVTGKPVMGQQHRRIKTHVTDQMELYLA